MLEQIKKRMEEVMNSKAYNKYMEENPEAYFVSAFIMGDYDKISGIWTIDFYSAEKHKVMSFSIHGNEDGEILQKNFQKLEILKLEDVKTDLDEAFQKLKDLFAKEYPNVIWGKSIIVLQMKEEPLWNITLTTGSFEIFNSKISAVTGEIKEHKMEKLVKM